MAAEYWKMIDASAAKIGQDCAKWDTEHPEAAARIRADKQRYERRQEALLNGPSAVMYVYGELPPDWEE